RRVRELLLRQESPHVELWIDALLDLPEDLEQELVAIDDGRIALLTLGDARRKRRLRVDGLERPERQRGGLNGAARRDLLLANQLQEDGGELGSARRVVEEPLGRGRELRLRSAHFDHRDARMAAAENELRGPGLDGKTYGNDIGLRRAVGVLDPDEHNIV